MGAEYIRHFLQTSIETKSSAALVECAARDICQAKTSRVRALVLTRMLGERT